MVNTIHGKSSLHVYTTEPLWTYKVVNMILILTRGENTDLSNDFINTVWSLSQHIYQVKTP